MYFYNKKIMSENGCGHCKVAGYAVGGICTVAASRAGGIAAGIAAGAACRTAVASACGKISHCSVTKSAQ